ncbi:hypothetical protein EDC30_10544 [Paucimonas lemoignei]|uniref:Lipoprotein n=1 Tax=Paucimonas lemoignei TaxID=29443 RepID=A0A4R3HXB7_PAULE|nr:hypothetical protein [Paucimonas lemoignei]TCS36825.1 hypothetical protein EDC30_10544 [Paucimonas lemoignei]
MDSKLRFKRIHLAVAGALLATLVACGGGSSGAPAANQQAASMSFSGSAAVGAPLAGTVTVKDALGATKTTPIGPNGSYTIDVTGMTAPFVFRAQGTANGQTYVVHSIATAADAASGKINITQLTDLVVANIAGQIAKNYFDKFEQNGNADAATKAAVDAEVDKLKEKLLPVLTALGVDAGIDLLRTPFTPLSSALDKALDAIQVSVDPNANVATISTLVNTITITDDLAVKAVAEVNPPKLDATNVTADSVASTASDAVLVKKALTDFFAQFASGLPTAAQLMPYITTGFLLDDKDGATFRSEVSAYSALVGATISEVEIHDIDYSDLTKVTARVSFTLLDKNGVEIERERNWRVRKIDANNWRLHGNQRALEISAYAHMVKGINPGGTCFLTGLEFDIEDYNTANNGGTISYILVTGPGLPNGGLRYDAPGLGGKWKISGQVSPYYVMADSCNPGAQTVVDSAIAAIPDNAVYTFMAYTGANAKINFPTGTSDGTYALKLQRRPLTLAEVQAAAFPAISSPTILDFAGYTSGNVTIVASNINSAKYGRVYLGQNTSTNDFRETENDVAAAANGTINQTLGLTPASGGTINWRTLRAESIDAYRRLMSTTYAIGTQP